MAAFASVEDYEARYGTVSDAERVSVLLGDAGDYIEYELARKGKSVDKENELQASALVRISCRLVHDMVGTGEVMPGVSQTSMTAGPFSGSWSFANPSGAFMLLRSERKTLGISGGRVGSVEPRVVTDDS